MRWTLVILFLASCLFAKQIPGCPDLDVLENELSLTPDALNNLLLCFCKVESFDKVTITCLYGSNLDHLKKATEAVKLANLTTVQITIQHMEFSSSGIPDFALLAPHLSGLDIRECTNVGSLVVPETVFTGLESILKNLTIHACNLKTIPSAIAKLDELETLTLSSNKLENIPAEIFRNKLKLRYLDLSGNFVNYIEENSFEPLKKLETIIFGEHNYINETILAEIGKLKLLKNLDLSRADGVFEPPTSLFTSVPELKTLKLSGCSIPKLERGEFSSLKNLEQLDLRVNLIENVSAYAFDGLSNLKRLSLAGNYIRTLEKDFWVGLENLEEIDLGWNEISNLPEGIFAPLAAKLKVLNLRHNPISTLVSTGLKNLLSLTISECNFLELLPKYFKDYPKLEVLDVSRCNITLIDPDTFSSQRETLKILHIEKNRLKSFNANIVKHLSALEELDISGNNFICSSEIANLIFAIEDRYRDAAISGKDFLLINGNDTLCDRPYTLREQSLLGLNTSQLQPYDEKADTTTVPTTTVMTKLIEDSRDKEDTVNLLEMSSIIVGANMNETFFKEEPHREIYDLGKTDNSKNSVKQDKEYLMPTTFGVFAIISLITLVAVGLFMKKKRKMVAAEVVEKSPKHRNSTIDDGMIEIELDNQIKR